MPLIAAKCTQCGANIEVDDSKEAGICQACGTPFATEKAINYFNQSISIDKATINIQGVDVNNILLRAQQFEIEGDIDKAKEYYNKVLDVDITNPTAISAMDKIKKLESMVVAGNMVPVNVISKIDTFLQEGLKIKAINELREAIGVGFKEANDAVSSYA